jgi:hypothetical protein
MWFISVLLKFLFEAEDEGLEDRVALPRQCDAELEVLEP